MTLAEKLEHSHQELHFRDRAVFHKFLIAVIRGIVKCWQTRETEIKLDNCLRPVRCSGCQH